MQKFEHPFNQDALCHLVEIGVVVLKIFQKSLMYFVVLHVYCYYLPLELGCGLHLNKLESTLPKMHYAKLVEIGPVVLEEIFESHQCIFTILQLSPLHEGCGPET